jgi:Sulfotransferase family
MVLVSFQKQFIYTKTNKTAGTSVEVFFEPYCLPPEGYQPAHFREETVTDYGVVGFRGPNKPAGTLWYNHMPAARIREYLGRDVWNEYFKFCVVRNPFDKLVSMYCFQRSRETNEDKVGQEFSLVRRDFLDWIKDRRFVPDRDRYMIDGTVCVDYFIRFETLREGLGEACQRLGLERDVSELERFKSDTRPANRHFFEFYDDAARAVVAEAYAFELDYFGYRPPD